MGPGGQGPGVRAPRPALSRPGRRRRTLLAAALLAGLSVLMVSVLGAVAQVLPRAFSPGQRQQIAAWEMGRRWRVWTAGEIFPAGAAYRLSASLFADGRPVELAASRVGIAPQARCRSALDPGAVRALDRDGCLAVLRATYEDATRSLAVTVGVVVMPDPAAAQAALRAFTGTQPRPGLRAVAFRHTPAAWFGDAERQVAWRSAAGPYLIMATAGYADGRPRAGQADPYAKGEMLGLASGAGQAIAGRLGARPPQPRCPGTPGC